MSVTVVSGIRELAEWSFPAVELAIVDEATRDGLKELRFGGALGVDSIALGAAVDAPGQVRLVSYVPFTLHDQPERARHVTADCSDAVVELRLPRGKAAYLRRNDAMLNGATRLLAFTDGRASGGTFYTISQAAKRGLPIDVVEVLRERVAENPRITKVDLGAPVYAWARYVSGDSWSDLIKAMKRGAGSPAGVRDLAKRLADLISATPDLRTATSIIPMPRRRPGEPSDLLDLAQEIGRHTGQFVLADHLVRTTEPQGGLFAKGRIRFSADEHARTVRWDRPAFPDWLSRRPLVLDNVLTLGGTMGGAVAALKRDLPGCEPIGLAALYSRDLESGA